MIPRLYVTGTDTDVGKTTIVAAAARTVRERFGETTIVKIAQTGIGGDEPGDAHVAAALARCAAIEIVRYPKPADPWTAALDADVTPLRASDAAKHIASIPGALVVEGSGGAAVPLNEDETITDVASLCDLSTVLVVGLRIGCMSHAILTLEYLRRRNIRVVGIVCCERWPQEPSYPRDVQRVLARHDVPVAHVPFNPNAAERFEAASIAFAPIVTTWDVPANHELDP